MNLTLKHFILAVFSLALVLATVFISRPARDSEEMKRVKFGYPFSFVSQDFSWYDTFHFFPRYQNFELKRFSEMKDFSFVFFLASFVLIFLAVELIIYILEFIKSNLFKP